MTRTASAPAADTRDHPQPHRCGSAPGSVMLHAVRRGGSARAESICGLKLHPPARRRNADAGWFEDRWPRDACCLDCGRMLGLDPPSEEHERDDGGSRFPVSPAALLGAALLGAMALRLLLVAIR